jgi:hypothetical protein
LEEIEELLPQVTQVKTKIDFGKGQDNPLNSAYFFEKNRPNVLFHMKFSAPKK